MNIGINGRFLQQRYMEGYGNYVLYTALSTMAQLPTHQYILFVDEPYALNFALPANCTVVQIGRKARHPLAWHYWYNIVLTAALRKHKIDLLLTFDGFCSLTTKVPQFLAIHDLAFLHQPKGINALYRWYYKRYTPKFIQKAAMVFTVSEFCKQDIVQHYPKAANKTTVLYNGIRDVFTELPWRQQNEIRANYSDDTNYFLYVGSVHPRKNIVTLLKAFSVFKKWQKSSMKLMIVGRMAWKNDEFEKLIATYKHRQDVILTGYLPTETVANIMASAYALLYPSIFEGFGVPIVEAMRCGVPVITNNNSGMLEAGGDAAFYCDTNDFDSIAKQMQLVFKNEDLKCKHVVKGRLHAQNFDWTRTVSPLIQAIQNLEKK